MVQYAITAVDWARGVPGNVVMVTPVPQEALLALGLLTMLAPEAIWALYVDLDDATQCVLRIKTEQVESTETGQCGWRHVWRVKVDA